MTRLLSVLFLVLALPLAACKQEEAQDVSPREYAADTIGHYCQMNLLEHDGPKAQVHLEGIPDPLFFSQARDAIAYMRAPEQIAPILAVYVNDMGREGATWEAPGVDNWISVDDAFFVLGSRREGGMGAPETVPFGTEAGAQDFAATEGGAIMRLAAIPDSEVLAPVELHEAEPGDEADFQSRLRGLTRDQKPLE